MFNFRKKRRQRVSFSLALGLIAVVYLTIMSFASTTQVAFADDPILPEGEKPGGLPAQGSCGVDDLGHYVKFTTGGVDGTYDATATGGNGGTITANYTQDSDGNGDTGTFLLNSVELNGEPLLVAEVIGGIANYNPIWTFMPGILPPTPLLATLSDKNFSQFALCVYDAIGPFSLTKTVDSGSGSFTFDVVCASPSGEVLLNDTVTLDVTAGTPVTYEVFGNVPIGATCTATETSADPDIYDNDGPKSATVAGVEGAGVTINNTLKVGSLQINKSLDDGGSGFDGDFSISYSCTDGSSGTVDVTPGTPVTINNIEAGAQCTISETLSDPPAGYSWSDVVITPNPAIVTAGGIVEVTVANELTRDTGTLAISKSLADGSEPYDGAFTISYLCTLDGADDISGSVDVAAGGSATVEDIPTGYECVVTETTLPDVPGYSWSDPVITPALIVIDEDGGTFDVSVVNNLTRDTGTLAISKSLADGSEPYDGAFTISYLCTLDGADDISGSVDVAAGGSATVEDIPTGYECVVTETTLPDVPGYSWSDPVITPALIVIDEDGGTFDVSVVNNLTRDTGTLAISKSLADGSEPYDGAFTISYLCTLDGADDISGSVDVAAGGSATVEDIPTGYECVVTETTLPDVPGYSWSDPVITPALIVIDEDGGTFDVSVVNNLTRDTGTLAISKSLADGSEPYDGAFTISYLCTLDGADDISGSVDVAAGGSATVEDIPTGYECVVTETTLPDVPGYSWSDPVITPALIVIDEDGGTFDVSVVNNLTRDTGTLAISKSLADGSEPYDGAFTISYLCTLDGADDISGSVDVAAGGSATVEDIPTGYECVVTETTLPDVPGYSWSDPVITPALIVIDEDGGTFDVSVVNNLTRDTGTLAISKSLADGSEPYDGAFTISYLCTLDGADDISGSVDVAAGGSATVEDIPTGYECVVTETTLPDVPGYSWSDPVITPALIVIDEDGGTFDVSVVNNLTLIPPQVTIDKQVRELPDGEWMDDLGEVFVGTQLEYRFIVENIGEAPLVNVTVTDPLLGELLFGDPDHIFCSYASLPVGGSEVCGPFGPISAEYDYGMSVTNTATVEGCAEADPTVCDDDDDDSTYTALYWGFTPGFWKNHGPHAPSGHDAWQYTDFNIDDEIGEIFDIPGPACDLRLEDETTLMDALNFRGGPKEHGAAQILLRAGVSALLNASIHEGDHLHAAAVEYWDADLGRHVLADLAADPTIIYYPYTSQGVIDAINTALASCDRTTMLTLAAELDGYNNGIHDINWD